MGQDESRNSLASRVIWIGILIGFLTFGLFLIVYNSLGEWQILAAALAILLGVLSLFAGFLSLRRDNIEQAGSFTLLAVFIAYAPGELFWSGLTINNLMGGSFLILLIGLAMIPGRVRTWISLSLIYLVIILAVNIFEPIPRFNVELSPTLDFYVRSTTIFLTLVVSWMLVNAIRTGDIRTRLVTAFLMVTLIPLGLLALINNINTQNILTNSANQLLFAVASDTVDAFDDYISNQKSTILTESQQPTFAEFLALDPESQTDRNNPIRAAANTLLSSLARKDFTRIRSYALLDANGINVLDTVFLDIGNDESNTEYFNKSYSDKLTFASSVEFSLEPGVFHSIYFSSPVRDVFNEIVGVLRVKISASVLQETIQGTNDLAGEDSFGVLFEEIEGNFLHLAHGAAPETLFTTIMPYEADLLEELRASQRIPLTTFFGEVSMNLPELHENLNALDEEAFFTATDIATGDRINQISVLRSSENPDWIIAYFQPQDIFLAVAEQQALSSIVLVIIIAVFVAAIAIFVARLLSDPITQLTKVAQSVAGGDLTARAEVISQDEVGILATAFNSMTDQVNDVITNLEDTVALRTQALEKRAQYLEAAAEVGRVASEFRDLDKLLDTITHLVSDRFDFYHVGILLLDDSGEYAVLKASNSEGGWRMIARGHRLRVGEEGIVGYVTSTGEARIEQSVKGEGAFYFGNPELPNTRSELALPLKTGDQIFGALDVQSVEEEAFSEEDVTVLQVLADQVAMAINNALLLDRVQKSLEIERRVFGELSAKGWDKLIQAKPDVGFHSTIKGTSPVGGDWHSGSEEALRIGDSIQSPDKDDPEKQLLSVPLKIHGDNVIGILETYKLSSDGPWTTQEISILEAISDQLGAALENARLFEATQSQAQRERITSEVASRIWASSSVDTILETAVQELGRALNASQGTIRLDISDQDKNIPD